MSKKYLTNQGKKKLMAQDNISKSNNQKQNRFKSAKRKKTKQNLKKKFYQMI